MDNIGYTALTRQSGLLREMQNVANNIANMSTTGFRREGVVFSEYIQGLDQRDPSLSMGHANARVIDLSQGAITQTGGTYDFAIEGDGFFLIDTPEGQMLSRAGSFTPSAEGELVTPDGYRLLDGGGSPVFVPSNAQSVILARDGTLSADGVPLANIGLYLPSDPLDLVHKSGVMFDAPGGVEQVLEDVVLLQGFVEGSNVNPVLEITRMIEVQRSYELGQQFMQQDDERIRSAIKTMLG